CGANDVLAPAARIRVCRGWGCRSGSGRADHTRLEIQVAVHIEGRGRSVSGIPGLSHRGRMPENLAADEEERAGSFRKPSGSRPARATRSMSWAYRKQPRRQAPIDSDP